MNSQHPSQSLAPSGPKTLERWLSCWAGVSPHNLYTPSELREAAKLVLDLQSPEWRWRGEARQEGTCVCQSSPSTSFTFTCIQCQVQDLPHPSPALLNPSTDPPQHPTSLHYSISQVHWRYIFRGFLPHWTGPSLNPLFLCCPNFVLGDMKRNAAVTMTDRAPRDIHLSRI